MAVVRICIAFFAVTLATPLLAATRPPGIDLEVTYINRAPMYERYRVNYPGGKPVLQAGTENARRWPTNGELVTFTAYLANKGDTASGPFDYAWMIDGAVVASGTYPGLPADGTGTVTYQWVWSFQTDGERVLDDHTVACVLDPANTVPETFENNNRIDDYINAMSFYLAITPAMVTTYSNPAKTNFPFSAENWLQRQIAAMNRSFSNSTYPLAPSGITERARINVIDIRADNPTQYTNDGSWFVNADYRVVSGGYDRNEDIDWSLVHELSHQLGLIDIYNYNVESDSVFVLGAEGLPCNFAFTWPRADLMGGGDIAPHTDGHLYSSFSVGAMNSGKGYRRGYYGEFQFDVPRTNYLRVQNNRGQPVEGARVELFQRAGDIDNVPEIVGVTDANGLLLLNNRSVGGDAVTRTGHTLRDNPFGIIDVVGSRNTFLARISKDVHEEFTWLNLIDFNLGYWSGNPEQYVLVLPTHLPAQGAPAAPASLTAQPQGQSINLCWGPVRNATYYSIYAAYSPEYRYKNITNTPGTCFTIGGHTQNRVYVVTATDSAGRESGFSPFAWVPRLVNPTSVAIARDGMRIILDPQNGHALIEQRWDGRFIRNIGSVHYHLEYSQFLSIDAMDRLLINHPADFYSSRHSVRVANRQADALLEFGQRGSALGQFETPTGVAAYGTPATIEGPRSPDLNTLLLLHFDGDHNGTAGEVGTAVRTAFAPARYGQGVLITNSASLTYPSAGNIQREAGAIEFWVQPNWQGNDGVTRYFVAIGAPFNNGFQIVKDGANNLRLMMWQAARESGVGYGIGGWRTGEWHHVAATWDSNKIALYVDGQQRSSSTNVALPNQFAATIYVGSSTGSGSQVNGVMDEFRISSVPRAGNSDTAGYRIIVADSGNHRVQAFDENGGFIAAAGSFGSGAGQFNDPRGVAVDAVGRILVADRNNNRLQVLTLTGTNFTFLAPVTGPFNRPVGVTAFRDTHWIVADTGNSQIKILNTNGTLLQSVSAPNDGYALTFQQPAGVTTDGAGRIIVADTGNDRIVTIRGLLPTNAPPRFLPEYTRHDGVTFQSRIRCVPGQRIVVQSTPDLILWSDATNTIAVSDSVDFRDSRNVSTGHRSYRAIAP